MRSGVNWMRPNASASVWAKDWARSVLAVPGAPSSRMWPPASRLVNIRSMASSWPTTAFPISVWIASAILRALAKSTGDLLPPCVNLLRRNGRAESACPAFAILLEPAYESRQCEARRRTQSACGVAHHLFVITRGEHELVAVADNQGRARVDQAAATRIDSGRQFTRRAESSRR